MNRVTAFAANDRSYQVWAPSAPAVLRAQPTDPGSDVIGLAGQLGLTQRLLDFYGIADIADFDSPETLAYRAEVDMLDLMDADDPPFYIQKDLEPATMPVTVNLLYHHANHALLLAEQGDQIGLENVAYIQARGIADPSGEDSAEFSLRHFGM